MSTISLNAGDTGWQDSVTCDRCGAKDERTGTGVMRRVPLGISDPRYREAQRGTGMFPLPEIEYEERRYPEDSQREWGWFGIRPSIAETAESGPRETRRQLDFCPQCAAVIGDLILEQTKRGSWGTQEERQYGTEVPPPSRIGVLRSVGMTFLTDRVGEIATNLRAAGELGAAIGDGSGQGLPLPEHVYSAMLGLAMIPPPGQPIPHLRGDPVYQPRHSLSCCLHGCFEPAVRGGYYCAAHLENWGSR